MRPNPNRFILIVISGLLNFNAFAVSSLFTTDEKEIYQRNKQVLAEAAADCLDATYAEHEKFFNEHKISKFYGIRRKDYATRQGRIEALRRYGAPISLVDQLEPMSCIGLSLRCLEKGFKSIGLDAAWTKIHAKLAINNKFLGTDLISYLSELGWTTIYWNPDPTQNADWDEEDKKLNPAKDGKNWNPVWGGHQYHYNMVKKKGTYYGIQVNDRTSLVGFRTSPPPFFERVPFFIGIAHAGYHVFPGRLGDVVEAHSMRDLNSKANLEFSFFNPLAPNGGPRWTQNEHYRSGLIVIP
jgi:hypothetical protein